MVSTSNGRPKRFSSRRPERRNLYVHTTRFGTHLTQIQNPVCKLNKSLYGLKQASRVWYQKLSTTLKHMQFTQCKSDHSLFIRKSNTSITIILAYVDDLLITGNDLAEIKRTKTDLHDHFNISDLGELRYFLGIEMAKTKEGLYLGQHKYALDIIKTAKMLDCKPTQTPCTLNNKQSKNTITTVVPLDDPQIYRSLVGKLVYLTVTRPDITYTVNALSQKMSAPTNLDMQAGFRMIRYVKGSLGTGLHFSSSSTKRMAAYSDSDWAACPTTRRSMTGYCVYLGQNIVSWQSRKQHTVSKSSAEAEYRALSTTACETTWITSLLTEINDDKHSPARRPRIYTDNTSAASIARNPVSHQRTKHIEIDVHFVGEKVLTGAIELLYVPTTENPADNFTKPLPGPTFNYLLPKLHLLNIHKPPEIIK